MKKLKLSNIRSQLAELEITGGPISTLRTIIKASETKYQNLSEHKDLGVKRLELKFSDTDIEHLKIILEILENPTRFILKEHYLSSILKDPIRMKTFLEKFDIEKSSIKCITDDITTLILEQDHGL